MTFSFASFFVRFLEIRLLTLNAGGCTSIFLDVLKYFVVTHLGLNSTLKLVQLLTPSQPWSEVAGSRDWEEAEHVEVD